MCWQAVRTLQNTLLLLEGGGSITHPNSIFLGMEQIEIMVAMTTQLQQGMQSTTTRKRKWSAIKAAFKEDKITKFQSRLMDAKTTLILVRQTLSE